MHIFSQYQQKQVEVVNAIEEQVKNNSMEFSRVDPVDDYANDTRICLTSVHFPHQDLIKQVQDSLLKPLQKISPNILFYPSENLHMTVKNIRIIKDPPNFTEEDIEKAEQVFDTVIPKHKKFNVYFYRLLLFPNNLALIGTTDPELDSIVLELDKKLRAAGVPDDKKYMNAQYFFSNMTLARFNDKSSEAFIQKVTELSQSLSYEPYIIDSVTLLSCTAVLTKKRIIKAWNLED